MKQTSRVIAVIALSGLIGSGLQAQTGLNMGMGSLSRLSKAKTRSISPENFTGEKGKAGMAVEGTGKNAAKDLGQGWKISPSVKIKSKETFVLGEINGSGAIQHIWMTPTGHWRYLILRMYWDGESTPSVEVPVGDFFASGWNQLKKRSGDVRNVLNEATSIGPSRDHKPVPSERKSGMPDGVEMPAPVSTTARFALRNNSAASSIAVMMASEGLAGLLIWEGPRVRR